MSIYIMSFIGMIPIGSLIAGSIAERFGVTGTLFGGACLFLVGSLLFIAWFPRLCRELHLVYQRLGILAKPSADGNGTPTA